MSHTLLHGSKLSGLPFLLALAALFLLAAPAASAATFVVDRNDDANVSACTAGPNDCTLRGAMTAANANPGFDTINFAIGVAGSSQSITITSALPVITAVGGNVSINGWSQGGGSYSGPPLIELNGNSVAAVGLNIQAGSSTISGLVINRFGSHGIVLLTGDGNTVQGCYIGTNAAGTADLGNAFDGISIQSSSNNTIGGTTAAARNLISGNNNSGVAIQPGSTGNNVRGNLIGTDITGTLDLGNNLDGVFIGDTSDNNVGGINPGTRNIISGNNRFGVYIFTFTGSSPSTGNRVQGNYIGTDINGNADLGNSIDGVAIFALNDGVNPGVPNSGNLVGGTSAAARNIISGNNRKGIYIFGDNAMGNIVQGNYVGTNVAGMSALPNSEEGVIIENAPNNIVGGTDLGARNLLSGNGNDGIEIRGNLASGNVVAGNYIGTNPTGMVDLGNVGNGVSIEQAPNNIIGGTTAAARNIISGNNADGVVVARPNASGNVVAGNYIGTNLIGTAALPNSITGVRVFQGAANNTIGGATAGARNLISGNASDGLRLEGAAGDNPSSNIIQGNYIGTNAAGTASVTNGRDGIRIQNSTNNLIGGTAPGAGNLISGNTTNSSNGILILGAASTGNVIQGNFIGTNAAGTGDLGNGVVGVSITTDSSNNLVGGPPGAGNVIAFNFEGIVVTSNTSVGNTFLANSIFSNDLWGIDLNYNGPTANDADDPDIGPNNLQNYPVLTRVTTLGGMTTVSGTLNSVPSSTFTIEFFAVAQPDTDGFGNGFGEGERYLDTRTVTTNAAGDVNFSFVLPGVVPLGQFVSATATRNSTGDTSEFSRSVLATTSASFVVNSTDDTADANIGDGACDVDTGTPGSQCTLRAAIQESNALPDQDIINFNIPGAGVRTINVGSTGLFGLPEVTNPVIINGYSQPGSAPNSLQSGSNATILIELNGAAAGVFQDGLRIRAGSSTVRGLVINRFNGDGIELNTNGGNVIEGCFIGTDTFGNIDLGNARTGVYVNAVGNNIVGGINPAQRMVVSGNDIYGVGFEFGGPGNNQLLGSIVGLNAVGTARLGNTGTGVQLSTSNNTVGGTSAGARNVISGNGLSPGTAYGVNILGAGVTGNVVLGNYIGTDAAGNVDLGNTASGVLINASATGNTVGGSAAGAGNLISGNDTYGVFITTQDNTVQGNLIGTNVTGNARLANGADGVILYTADAHNNLVGGTTAGARNVISGNAGTGVDVFDASGNTISGNYLGVGLDGTTPLGNNGRGVLFATTTSSNNTVGGTAPEAGNRIAFNGVDGVSLFEDVSNLGGTGNAILSNSIYSNGNSFTTSPGIDISPDGPNPNDAGDADTGPNNRQNYPVLSSAFSDGSIIFIVGSLNSAPSTTFQLQFFANDVADASGNGEGKTFLATRVVTTNASGDVNFSFVLPGSLNFGQFVTATATDPGNNTSEFSADVPVNTPGTLQLSSTAYSVAENVAGGVFAVTVTRTSGDGGAVSIPVLVTPGTATRGTDYSVQAAGQPAGVSVISGSPAGGDTVTLSFASGEVSKTFLVSITNDATEEPAETVNLSLGAPTGGALVGAANSAVLTITNDDAAPTISVNDVTVTEGDSGTTSAVFTVSLSTASLQAVTVDYLTSGGTASSPADYQSVSGTLNFPAGTTTRTITVPVNGDTLDEGNETFLVNLSNPTGAAIADAQGLGTITDDDASAVSLNSASYTVSEGALRLTVQVTRSGDTSVAGSVDYATSDSAGLASCGLAGGMASERCDYNTTLGRLRFAAGETSKTFDVFITDDAYVEGPEVFSITLSNPTGLVLGGTTTATATITDNDVALSSQNPIDTTTFFVRQHYVDFLNREPDPVGFNGWINILNNCPAGSTLCDRVEVSSAFYRSEEFQTRGYFIYRFYAASLGRLPNYREFIFDLSHVSGFLSGAQLEAAKGAFITEFMNRQEFRNKYDALTDQAYVNLLEQTAGVTLANKQQLIDQLQGGQKTRAEVLRAVVESNEVATKFFNEAFVVMEYFGYLRRNPDAAFQAWINTLNTTGNYRSLVNGFMNSLEYRLRFAP